MQKWGIHFAIWGISILPKTLYRIKTNDLILGYNYSYYSEYKDSLLNLIFSLKVKLGDEFDIFSYFEIDISKEKDNEIYMKYFEQYDKNETSN